MPTARISISVGSARASSAVTDPDLAATPGRRLEPHGARLSARATTDCSKAVHLAAVDDDPQHSREAAGGQRADGVLGGRHPGLVAPRAQARRNLASRALAQAIDHVSSRSSSMP